MRDIDDIASDTVIGIEAISAYTGINKRRTHYLAASGQLPGVFRMGRSWGLLKSVYAAELRARATRACSQPQAGAA